MISLNGPRLVDAVLCIVAVEAVALAVRRRRTGRGPALGPLLAFLGSGAALLVALRAALAGAPAWTVPAALAAAGLLHLRHLRDLARPPAGAGGRAGPPG
jgi:hypothetical protein